MNHVGPTRGVRLAVVAAGAWGLVLVVGAFTVPVYGTASYIASATSPGISPGAVRLTETVVDVKGLVGAVEMAVPLMATLVVAAALRRAVDLVSLVVAWTATGLLALLGLLSIRSIGLPMIPATVALVLACAMATRVARASGT